MTEEEKGEGRREKGGSQPITYNLYDHSIHLLNFWVVPERGDGRIE
jgi:hypothetical protein